MIAGESIIHHYCMATVKFGIVLMIGAVVIGYVWFKWIKNR